MERLDDRVLALHRAQGTAGELLCVTNVTDADVTLSTVYGIDVLTGTAAAPLRLGRPYGFAWVRPRR